jgi:hypothetical protein
MVADLLTGYHSAVSDWLHRITGHAQNGISEFSITYLAGMGINTMFYWYM